MRLSIEKMIYGGDGLARLPGDDTGRGKAAFLPFVLAGEQVDASVIQQKAGFVRAKVESVVERSQHRTEPACPYFEKCGGCHYQHSNYEHQLEIKQSILRETLRRTAKLDLDLPIQVHASPPWNYRNRSRLQIQAKPEFAAGYFRISSHTLLPVEECPISSPLVNRAIAALWQSGREGKVPIGITEVEFFADAADSSLLIEVSCSTESRRSLLRSWAEEFLASMTYASGLSVWRPSERKGNPPDELLSLGSRYLNYATKKASYRVSAGSFFQVNRHMIDELVSIVTGGATGELALDLYAGVGLFSTALSGDIRHTVSVESSQTSSGDLAYNLGSNGEAVQASAEQYLARVGDPGRTRKGSALPQTFRRPDLAVVDPPRSGLGERVARELVTLGAPRVVYVSCDPSTLARDLLVFLGAGYRVQQIHLVDLFPQTFHLETAVHLFRS